MPDVKAVMLKYTDQDEALIRRLGSAVVTQWANLPQDVRDRILQQAIFIYDRDVQVGLHESLRARPQRR